MAFIAGTDSWWRASKVFALGALMLILLVPHEVLFGMPGGSVGKAKEPYRFGTPGVMPPIAIHKVQARYSSEARQACVEGDILLRVLVDRRGRNIEGCLQRGASG